MYINSGFHLLYCLCFCGLILIDLCGPMSTRTCQSTQLYNNHHNNQVKKLFSIQVPKVTVLVITIIVMYLLLNIHHILMSCTTETTLASKSKNVPKKTSNPVLPQPQPSPKSQPAVPGVSTNNRPSTAVRPPSRATVSKVRFKKSM